MGVNLNLQCSFCSFQRITNCQQDPFPVCQYVVIPESQHAISLFRQPRVTHLVVILVDRVLATIHFNNQSNVKAREIDDVSPYRNLSPKAITIHLPVVQKPPQSLLRIRHHLAQTTCVRISQAQKLGGELAVTTSHSSSPTLRKRCGMRLSK